jgi:hypothetical protein
MAENPDNKEETVGGIRVMSEQIGFASDQMTACGKCGKANPPNRLNCFYCGGELAVAKESAHDVRLNIRELEAWENGFNIVLLPGGEGFGESDVKALAAAVSIDNDVLAAAIDSIAPTPIARVESETQGAILRNRLETKGLKCAIVADEKLEAANLPVRLRAVDFAADQVILFPFNVDKPLSISAESVDLIVVGIIFENKTQATIKRSKKEVKTIDETEQSSDLAVLDFYSSESGNGFRIPAHGFDFSCLANEKSMLASENMPRLVELLRLGSPDVKFVNDYVSKRHDLDNIWPLETRNDSKGIHSTGFGRYGFSKGASTNNTLQFTKYSRLQAVLL